MEALYFLVPVTLTLVGGGVALFMWAVRNGQMDDLERPGHSILYDDDVEMIPNCVRQPRHETAAKDQKTDP